MGYRAEFDFGEVKFLINEPVGLVQWLRQTANELELAHKKQLKGDK
ncbi:hypothetical protein [Enterococcus faecalis]